MAYTNIDLPTEYFRIKTYTGNATNDTAITWDESSNMQPDWLWFKNRSQTQSHAIFDVLRGVTKRLSSNSTSADSTELTNLDSFDTNGFTIDYEAIVNGSGDSMVAWGWKANGAGVSNTAGSIASTVSANTTAGFSIVSYTGTGANADVGHGLGVAPKMIIVKNRSATAQWEVYHVNTGNTSAMQLSGGGTPDVSSTYWNNTSPTSILFSIGTGTPTNGSGNSIIAYCFAEVKGYSKFGSYTGNGSADGTFIYTGFKPAFFILKRTDQTEQWLMKDNKRPDYNPNYTLYPNLTNAEDSSSNVLADFVSNGVKLRGTYNGMNASGGTYIYMAFAENPFVTSTGIPTPAR